MKGKNNAALRAILATGSYFKAELYTFSTTSGVTLRMTTAQTPLTVAGLTYDTALIITRGSIKQQVGFEVGSLSLTIAPQLDPLRPGGVLTVGGAAFLSAARAKFFDYARVSMTKIFFPYTPGGAWDIATAAYEPWYTGIVNRCQTGRFSCEMEVHDDLELLNVAMPRNLIQTSCLHTLFDAGCTLSQAAFTDSAQVFGTDSTVTSFASNLPRPTGYFDLGVVKFITGPNTGLSAVVKAYTIAAGHVATIRPFPSPPLNGDQFTITAGCKKTQAACDNTNPSVGPAFNNRPHFRGMPYVPVPETLYDGGTSAAGSAPVDTPGKQGGQYPISSFTGGLGGGTYQP